MTADLETDIARLEEELKLALVERDPADAKDVIVEVRQGVGGDEAAIWAGDVFRMLTRYAERRGFKTEILSANESETGGFKEVVFAVKGDGAYSVFKYEGGTHRVQRVPETESQGRIHTSTATVAVMPEAEDVEVEVNENDAHIQTWFSRTKNLLATASPDVLAWLGSGNAVTSDIVLIGRITERQERLRSEVAEGVFPSIEQHLASKAVLSERNQLLAAYERSVEFYREQFGDPFHASFGGLRKRAERELTAPPTASSGEALSTEGLVQA